MNFKLPAWSSSSTWNWRRSLNTGGTAYVFASNLARILRMSRSIWSPALATSAALVLSALPRSSIAFCALPVSWARRCSSWSSFSASVSESIACWTCWISLSSLFFVCTSLAIWRRCWTITTDIKPTTSTAAPLAKGLGALQRDLLRRQLGEPGGLRIGAGLEVIGNGGDLLAVVDGPRRLRDLLEQDGLGLERGLFDEDPVEVDLQQRAAAADLQLVAGGQSVLGDAPAVDQGSVGGGGIDREPVALFEQQLGVVVGHLRVLHLVEADVAVRRAADAQHRLGQLRSPPLQAPGKVLEPNHPDFPRPQPTPPRLRCRAPTALPPSREDLRSPRRRGERGDLVGF